MLAPLMDQMTTADLSRQLASEALEFPETRASKLTQEVECSVPPLRRSL